MRLQIYFLLTALYQLASSQIVNAAITPTLDEVIAGLEVRQQAIRSLKSIRIQFEWVSTDHTSFSEAQETEYIAFLKKNDFAGASGIPGSKVRTIPGGEIEFARKGNRLYCKAINPLNQRFGQTGLTAAFDGQAGVSIRGTDHVNISVEVPGDSWQFWQYPDLIHTNLEIDDRRLEANKRLSPLVRPVYLYENIQADKDRYRVVGVEKVAGHDCVHLSRDDDFDFWLSINEGFTLRKVDAYWAQTAHHQRLPRYTTKLRDLNEISPGLWMPFSIFQSMYSDPILDVKKYWGTISIKQELKVKDISVAELPDDFFRPKLPKGLRVNDFDRKMEYVTASDNIPFRDAINHAQTGIDKQASSWRLQLLLLVNAGLIACLVVWWKFSKG